MMRENRGLRPALAALLVSLLCSVGSVPVASGQLVVSDPTNLIQNTSSAVSEAATTVQLIRSVSMQTRQLYNQLQDLRKLEIENLEDLRRAYRQVRGVVARTRFVARRWLRLATQFDRLWGKYGPPDVDGATFWERRKAWEDVSDEASEHELHVQAGVGEAHAQLHEQAEVLEAQSKHVSGTVAATELSTKMEGVAIQQNALQIELALARAQAETAARLEQRRKDEASRARAQAQLSGGWESRPVADPVTLPDFD